MLLNVATFQRLDGGVGLGGVALSTPTHTPVCPTTPQPISDETTTPSPHTHTHMRWCDHLPLQRDGEGQIVSLVPPATSVTRVLSAANTHPDVVADKRQKKKKTSVNTEKYTLVSRHGTSALNIHGVPTRSEKMRINSFKGGC